MSTTFWPLHFRAHAKGSAGPDCLGPQASRRASRGAVGEKRHPCTRAYLAPSLPSDPRGQCSADGAERGSRGQRRERVCRALDKEQQRQRQAGHVAARPPLHLRVASHQLLPRRGGGSAWAGSRAEMHLRNQRPRLSRRVRLEQDSIAANAGTSREEINGYMQQRRIC